MGWVRERACDDARSRGNGASNEGGYHRHHRWTEEMRNEMSYCASDKSI